jgi:hypothetical protein
MIAVTPYALICRKFAAGAMVAAHNAGGARTGRERQFGPHRDHDLKLTSSRGKRALIRAWPHRVRLSGSA